MENTINNDDTHLSHSHRHNTKSESVATSSSSSSSSSPHAVTSASSVVLTEAQRRRRREKQRQLWDDPNVRAAAESTCKRELEERDYYLKVMGLAGKGHKAPPTAQQLLEFHNFMTIAAESKKPRHDTTSGSAAAGGPKVNFQQRRPAVDNRK